MGKTFKILIADDHVLIRSGLRQILEAETEYSVIEAENGKEALKIIREGIVDLAILDIEMPEVNGFDVAKKYIRSQ